MQASEPDSLATHPQAAAIKAGKPDVQAPSGGVYTGNLLLLNRYDAMITKKKEKMTSLSLSLTYTKLPVIDTPPR